MNPFDTQNGVNRLTSPFLVLKLNKAKKCLVRKEKVVGGCYLKGWLGEQKTRKGQGSFSQAFVSYT